MATVAPASAFVQADPMNIDLAGPQTLAAQIVVVRRNGKDASSRLDLFRDEGDLVVGR